MSEALQLLKVLQPRTRWEGLLRVTGCFVVLPLLALAMGVASDAGAWGTTWFYHGRSCLLTALAASPFVFIALSWPRDSARKAAPNKYFLFWEVLMYITFFACLNSFIFNYMATTDKQVRALLPTTCMSPPSPPPPPSPHALASRSS